MSDKPTFFSELKRRNVYKVAVAYAVVSWLIIQIATQVFPFFEIPNWAVRLVVILLILGFPIALVLSWAFEITPEGIRRESEVSPNESITAHTGRKLIVLTVILAVLAAGLFAWQIFRPKTQIREAATAPSTEATPTAKSTAAAPSIPDKSIAVLPFDNLSDDKSNAYFAEGIQDEILTRLSKIAALKVISRTSTQKYKSAPDNLRDVGQQLGVANVLEGSVQKIANAVHVNVQLIKAATDEHLWAESYNRKLDDVFGVEGEVASAIAQQLKTTLTGAEEKAVTDRPTQNTAAYDAYLRGLAIEHNQYSIEAYQQAARDYADAVQLDPRFALAWARLAVSRSFLYFNAVDTNTNSAGAVKEAADRAMALAPEAGESWIAQGAYRYRILRDFTSAVTAYKEAQTRLPNNSFLLQNLAYVQRRLGLWQEAEATIKKALELDPRDFQLLDSIGGEFYVYLRRFDDAHAALDRALQLAPDSAVAHASKASVFQNQGRLPEAAEELTRTPADATDDFVVPVQVSQAMYERNFDKAIALIDRKLNALPAGQPLDSYSELMLVQRGYCQLWTGHDEDARKSFSRAVEVMNPKPDGSVPPDANGRPSTLAQAYAGLGEKEKALKQAKRAIQDYDGDAVNQPWAETALAQIQAHFGDHDAAIAALPHLLEVPAGLTIANLKLDPFWDPLRKDPRFQKLATEGVTASPNKAKP
jgi:TolB-like protein/cytochrome c-type biogenesis protein CcmH/NrfG